MAWRRLRTTVRTGPVRCPLLRAIPLSLLLLLLLAPGAHAASLVHLDANANVWVTSADGALQRQVTTDGSPEAPYAPPTADDAGVILTFGHPDGFSARLLRQDGTDARGPYALPASACSAGPVRSAITPDGSLIAAAWTDGRRGCPGAAPLRHGRHALTTTSVLFGDAPTALVNEPGAPLPSFDGNGSPRWITHPDRRLAAIRRDAIDVQAGDAVDAPMARWIGVPWFLADLDSFDVSRAGDFVLVETSSDGRPAEGEDRHLELLRVTGVPPVARVEHVCFAERLVSGAARPAVPRWSPDGTMIAWTGAAGILVSPAPVAGARGACVLAPRLVAPGGTDAAWTAAGVVPPAASGEIPARTVVPPSTIRKVTGAPRVNPAVRIAVSVTLRSARTIRIRVERLPAAGRKGRARLVGTLRFTGRTGGNRLVIRKVAGRTLPNGRYRLTITAYRHEPRTVVVTVGG